MIRQTPAQLRRRWVLERVFVALVVAVALAAAIAGTVGAVPPIELGVGAGVVVATVLVIALVQSRALSREAQSRDAARRVRAADPVLTESKAAHGELGPGNREARHAFRTAPGTVNIGLGLTEARTGTLPARPVLAVRLRSRDATVVEGRGQYGCTLSAEVAAGV
ncbi:MAG: hypothetical protein ACRD0J_10560 [Acidimicrobiales bacterium]